MEQISACTFRQFTTGFYFGKPDHETQIYDSNTYVQNYIYLGTVEEVDSVDIIRVKLHQKNKFSVEEEVEIMTFAGDNIKASVVSIEDEYGTPMESAPHPQQELHVGIRIMGESGERELPDIVKSGMVIRRKNVDEC